MSEENAPLNLMSDPRVFRGSTYSAVEHLLFQLNESVDLNTKRMCLLQDSNERAAGSLQILQIIFAGMLAFDFMDRLTGPRWSVSQSAWFGPTYESLVQGVPGLWWFINMFIWLCIGYITFYLWRSSHHISQGLTTIRIKVHRRIFVEKIKKFVYSKDKDYSAEDKNYDKHNDIVKVTYVDQMKRDWGGARPTITLEFDERNCFLYTITVQYNRRMAKKSLAFNADELKEKIMDELNLMDVWDLKGEDVSADDLAQDKRAAIEKMIEEEEAVDEEEEALEKDN